MARQMVAFRNHKSTLLSPLARIVLGVPAPRSKQIRVYGYRPVLAPSNAFTFKTRSAGTQYSTAETRSPKY